MMTGEVRPVAAQPTFDDAHADAGVCGDGWDLEVRDDVRDRGRDDGRDDGRGGGRFAGLLAGLDAVVGVRVDELSDDEIRAELDVLETVDRRVGVRTRRLAAALSHRQARRAVAADPDDPRAGERAEKQVRSELAGRLNWAPGRAKRTVRDGRRMREAPKAAAAADRGRLSARHVAILVDTLAHFPAGADRDRHEAELVDAATTRDVAAFGRFCRRWLAEVDHDAAMRDQARRNTRQRASIGQDDQGMMRLSGAFAGTDAEIVATAIHAFRRPDTPGEHRHSEAATADAIVDVCRVALDAGEAPTNRGVRPHVIITVPVSAVADGSGVADARWSGPIPYGEIRRLLADAGISWLTVDEHSGLPMVASPESRHVPVGLWRALELRDDSCVAVGCDTPAAWTDVMHLHHGYTDGGRLSPNNAALGCRRHHRLYDLHGWKITWHAGHPILHHPNHPPDPPDTDHGGSRPTPHGGRTHRPRDGPDP